MLGNILMLPEDTNPEDLVPRRMRKQYPQALLQMVDTALTTCQGNRGHAANMVGKTPLEMKNIINNTPWLKLKWQLKETIPPTPGEAVDIDRPPPVIGSTPSAVVKAIEAQDKIIQKGFRKMGYSEDEVLFFEALQTEVAGNIKGILDLTFGGAAHSTMKSLIMMRKMEETLADIDEHPEKYRKVAYTREGTEYEVENEHDYRLKVWKHYMNFADLQRKMNISVNEATKTRLMAQKLQQEMRGKDTGPKTVAGWETPGTE